MSNLLYQSPTWYETKLGPENHYFLLSQQCYNTVNISNQAFVQLKTLLSRAGKRKYTQVLELKQSISDDSHVSFLYCSMLHNRVQKHCHI